MTTKYWLTIGVLCAVPLTGCGSSKAKAPAPPPAPAVVAPAPAASPTPIVSGTVAEETVQATATVVKIDQKTRKVTLRGADGKETTITAGPEVRNLAQVKKGDVVVITYYESLVYDVVAADQAAPGVSTAEGAARAQPGQKPGGVVAGATTVTTTIVGIDKSAGTVTLQGPDGKNVTRKVRDTTKLDKVKVGDLVQLTFKEALAVSVETPAKKK